MESDEDDFVFYGTPIEREDDSISRKKKAIAESSGQLRALPAWKQEVSIYSFHRKSVMCCERELIGLGCGCTLQKTKGFGFVSYCEIKNLKLIVFVSRIGLNCLNS